MTTDETSEQIEFAWALSPRWATASSSDVVDVVERNDGPGLLVMIDVQGSGASGTRLANSLLSFARELIAGGADPGVAAQATSQHLYSLRDGKVSASLHIASIQPVARTLTVSGYGACTLAYRSVSPWQTMGMDKQGAGVNPNETPATVTAPLSPGESVIIANDGIAGDQAELRSLLSDDWPQTSPRDLAMHVIRVAIDRQGGRPKSDMAVAAVTWSSLKDKHRISSGAKSFQLRNHRSAL